jgi:hypothetical protein
MTKAQLKNTKDDKEMLEDQLKAKNANKEQQNYFK